MIDCGVDAIVIKVAALGLDPSKHLGMRLQEIQPHLLQMVNAVLFFLSLFIVFRSRFRALYFQTWA